MNDRQLGQAARAIRVESELRQQDVAALAGVSQSAVSRLERGRLDGMPLDTLRAIAKALGARVTVTLHWHGAALDRLLDERHALLCGRVNRLLLELGWQTATEVTFQRYADRGSVDILAGHAPTRTILIEETKTDLGSIEALQRSVDMKVRLADQLALERFGWRPLVRARLVVMPDASTIRRHVERHGQLLGAAFPTRGRAVREWLRAPHGPLSGILLLSTSRGATGDRLTATPQRVRRRASCSQPARPRPTKGGGNAPERLTGHRATG